MERLLEMFLGLPAGFLSRPGDLSLGFNPAWPWQQTLGDGFWNFILAAGAIALVIWAYRRAATHGRARRVVLGGLRAALLALVILMLNRPILVLGNNRIEPSILPVMIDDSLSMSIHDGSDSPTTQAAAVIAAVEKSRFDAACGLFTADHARVLRALAAVHQPRFYSFDATAQPIGPAAALGALAARGPTGQSTQIAESLRVVRQDLQGQRVAGVVLLTDGRDSPPEPLAAALAEARDWGVRVYPVVVGSSRAPVNVRIESADTDQTVFLGDFVNVRVTVRATGVGSGQSLTLHLLDQSTRQPLMSDDPNSPGPVEARVPLADGVPAEAELRFRPNQAGTVNLLVQAEQVPGQVDRRDSTRPVQLDVLDSRVSVLYVDGYPRWDYRYLKDTLLRDRSIELSCLLTSADADFAQEGTRPIARFPETMPELTAYDVVIFGDVDPRQFSDAQLQMINDFVSTRGGGFAMVSGPRYSPFAYKGTPIEAILPVNIAATSPDSGPISDSFANGFRLVPTALGLDSPIFRPFADPQRNAKFFREELPPLFWYCRNVTVKPGVGEVYAEHPIDSSPDGRKAPLLVLGRFGAGRTAFSAIDDSWRWRFYTGEHVFETYWIQQIRTLAVGHKAGQRRIRFAVERPAVDLGEPVRAHLRVLDPQLVNQLPDRIRVDVIDAATGRAVAQQTLQRQDSARDLYDLSFTADAVGGFTLRMQPLPGADPSDPTASPSATVEVTVPRLEFIEPRPDVAAMTRLAAETGGKLLDIDSAARELPTLIPSAAKVIPIDVSRPLYGAPIALALAATLLTAEWVLRKLWGMI